MMRIPPGRLSQIIAGRRTISAAIAAQVEAG